MMYSVREQALKLYYYHDYSPSPGAGFEYTKHTATIRIAATRILKV